MVMAIYVTGDTHGSKSLGRHSVDGFIPRLNPQNFPEQQTMTKEDVVVICGDFGGVWSTSRFTFEHHGESAEESYALNWLNERPFTTVFVPGNHENYDRLTGIKNEKLLQSWMYHQMPDEDKRSFRNGYPKGRWCGGPVRILRESVLMLEDGVFEINGRRCFVYGGANSHDISAGILHPENYATEAEFKKAYAGMHGLFRVAGISWWNQERSSKEREESALAVLEQYDRTVDFVFSHTCSSSDLMLCGRGDVHRINQFLEQLQEKLTYRHWFFGHLHENYDLPGGKDHLLYEQIIRIC